MLICELKQKEVINVCDCQRLGYISDIEFDPKSGKITKIIIPGPGRIWGFLGRDSEIKVPFDDIVQIGSDIVLVDIKKEKKSESESKPPIPGGY